MITTRQKKGTVVFEITDKVREIHKDPQNLFFLIFERLRVFDKESRLGLGLYLCRPIVDGYGGIIDAESKIDSGSKFRVFLPCEITQIHLGVKGAAIRFIERPH